jgi:hypothetical protein
MEPFGYSAWLWFKNSPMAQGAALVGVGLAIFWAWMTIRDRRRRAEMIREIEIKAERTSRKVTEKAKETANETIRQADEARASIPAGTPAGELPKHVQDILFDD